ncbi:MAG: hypothetical protein CMK24_00675 [Porticoccaceae bacterium]|nr:hypothetical protein [Porticoccaceae bacterium]|tara:strand:+ start:5813 stop:8017 length:2205 start_codon:yes stop_codon:yes gene_type:complete
MPLLDLKFKAGINKEITPYSEENGWVDCDKIRFRFGYPEKLNGWEKNSNEAFLGQCRGMHEFVALSGEKFLGLGTELKFYIKEGVDFKDITPIKQITSAGDVTFSASNGSPVITVSDTSHGCVANDFVTFSGAASLGGNITANVLNQEYQVTEVVDGNTYKISARTVSTIPSVTASGGISATAVNATGSDTGNGGGSVVGTYQIGTALNSSVFGTGWGAGVWGGTTTGALTTILNEGGTLSASDTTITVTNTTGIVASDIVLIDDELILVGGISSNDLTGCTRGHKGTTATTHANGSAVRLASGNADTSDDFSGWGLALVSGTITPSANLRIWTQDNFGEDLLLNERNGKIYYWDKTNGVNTRAKSLTDSSLGLGTRTSVPTIATQVLLSDRDRHVIAFGADGLGATSSATDGNGIQDPLLIRFSSQENPVDWYPTSVSTAGDLRISSGSKIIQAVETRQQILVFTDVSIHAMQFLGPPFTFGINLISENITIASPKAAVAVDDAVFWMGSAEFYEFNGAVQRIPCTVRDYVFNDINTSQSDKIIAGANVSFSEVWWFYPSSDSTENNRYVVYNYLEKIWFIGNLSRTAWLDRGISSLPLAAANNNFLYNQEVGAQDDGSAMTSFIESGDMSITDGNQFSFINRVIPDINFRETVDTSSLDFILDTKSFPGQADQSSSTNTVSKTSSTPVDQYTNQYFTRLRGRSFTLKIQSTDANVLWRLGVPRIDIRPDGRR